MKCINVWKINLRAWARLLTFPAWVSCAHWWSGTVLMMWGGLPELHFSAGSTVFVCCIVIYHSGVGLALFSHVQQVSVCWTCPGWHTHIGPVITTGVLCSGLCRCVGHAWNCVFWLVLTTGVLCTGLCGCVGHTWNHVLVWLVIMMGVLCRGLCGCVGHTWNSVLLWLVLTTGVLCTGLCRCVGHAWNCVLVWLVIATGVPCTGFCRCVGHTWNYVLLWLVITTGVLCAGLCGCVGHTWSDVRVGPVLHAVLAPQRAAERVPGSPGAVTPSLHGGAQLHRDERGVAESVDHLFSLLLCCSSCYQIAFELLTTSCFPSFLSSCVSVCFGTKMIAWVLWWWSVLKWKGQWASW